MGKNPGDDTKMEKKSKIGILKYIAKGGAKGCKFEDQPETWYNPATDEAKEQIKQEYVGKKVEIRLEGDTTKFTSMVSLEEPQKAQEEPQPTIEEEVVEADQEEERPQNEPKQAIYRVIDGTEAKENISYWAGSDIERGYTHQTYNDLERIKVDTATKGPNKLTYASWAEVWSKLKQQHPRATYHVHEDERTGMPYVADPKIGAFVKVSVTVQGMTHTVHLPVMDHFNKAVKGDNLDAFIINKNIMRAFAKAIAMHGLGLYVFRGEEFKE